MVVVFDSVDGLRQESAIFLGCKVEPRMSSISAAVFCAI